MGDNVCVFGLMNLQVGKNESVCGLLQLLYIARRRVKVKGGEGRGLFHLQQRSYDAGDLGARPGEDCLLHRRPPLRGWY